jgi:hypothetical protein
MPFQSPLVCANQQRVIITSEYHHMVMNTNTSMTRKWEVLVSITGQFV